MEQTQLEAILREQENLRNYIRYMALAITVILIVVLGVLILAWQSYSVSVAPLVQDMRTTMEEVHTMTAETASLLQEARDTMAEVKRTAGTIAPMVGAAQQTIQQAQETTQQVQAPLNVLRSIPVLNWFIQ